MADARLVATRYAQALSDATTAEEDYRVVVNELGFLSGLIGDSDELRRALENPVIGGEAKGRVVAEIAERSGAADQTRRFLDVLAEQERLDLIPEVYEAAKRTLDERLGVCEVEIRSASALDERLRARLTEALRQAAGSEIRMTERVDPDLLGGIVAQVGATVYDGSLRTRLRTLRARMTSGASGRVTG